MQTELLFLLAFAVLVSPALTTLGGGMGRALSGQVDGAQVDVAPIDIASGSQGALHGAGLLRAMDLRPFGVDPADMVRRWTREVVPFQMEQGRGRVPSVGFGWEFESNSPSILSYYRAKSTPDATWETMGSAERAATQGAYYDELVRRERSPDFLAPSPWDEGSGYEFTGSAPVRTMADLLEQVEWVRKAFLAETFHIHTSFRPAEGRTSQILDLLAQLDEWAGLLVFAAGPRAILNHNNELFHAGQLAQIADDPLLRAGSPAGWTQVAKFHNVGYRGGFTYNDPSLVGFEFRTPMAIDYEGTFNAIDTLVRFLDTGDDVRIQLGRQGAGYSLSSLAGVPRASSEWLEHLPPELRRFRTNNLLSEAEVAFPFLPFEERAHLGSHRETITRARERYVQDLEAIYASYDEALRRGSSETQLEEELSQALAAALHGWANRTKLYNYY
ncbi:MAG: hypothetical protein KC416_05275 [Myxococcales bacterium]|nr:hypothetical protein [Myxococcales bacterium]